MRSFLFSVPSLVRNRKLETGNRLEQFPRLRLRGQISTELMMIVGLILILFIPVLITIYTKALETHEKIGSLQSSIALSRLAGLINTIGALGQGAHVLTDIYVPANIESIGFQSLGEGGEVVFSMRQGNETSEYAEVVKFPLDGPVLMDMPEGLYRFNISNRGDKVAITRLS